MTSPLVSREAIEAAAAIDDAALTRLAGLAEAATPGPWAVDTSPGFEYHVRTGGTTYAIPSTGDPICDTALDADAEFIAAVSPSVVAALITEIRAQRELLGQLRQALASNDFADETLMHVVYLLDDSPDEEPFTPHISHERPSPEFVAAANRIASSASRVPEFRAELEDD